MATSNLAGIFLKRHVADVRQAILDAPVPTPPGQQRAGGGLLAGHAGDSILNVSLFLSALARHTHQPTYLSDGRPIEMARQAIGGLQSTMDPTSVFLVACFGDIKMRNALCFSCRGKKPP